MTWTLEAEWYLKRVGNVNQLEWNTIWIYNLVNIEEALKDCHSEKGKWKRKRISRKCTRHVFNVIQRKAICCHSIFFFLDSYTKNIFFKQILFPSNRCFRERSFSRLRRIVKAINVMQKLIRFKWIEFQVRPIGRKSWLTWRDKWKAMKNFL